MSAELMRLLSNIIRTGIISEVDEKSWRVRVRSGELETGWLRWNTTRAGAFNVWKAGGRAGVTLSGTVMQTMQNVELTITLRE